MDLRAFAEQVLFGPDVDRDKLVDPGRLSDAAPGAARAVPDAPARPRQLGFAARHTRGPRKLPSPAALEAPGARGRLLHAFANHELLALELMALALLRFPDAPPAWRMGLAATMRDEQRHLRRYRARMEACGVGLGEVPVSGFFWRCIADAPAPLDFAVRMGLVLEQANLDFAVHHRALFAAAGDAETAAVLDEVYTDEVRHLRHGLHWFRRLRPPGGSEWDAFASRLTEPLTPARAKGPVFDRAGRVAAGMDADFIERLAVFARSRGRPPRVWWFHPTCEASVAAGGSAPALPRAAAALVDDLALITVVLARPDDVVLVPRPVDPTHVARLEAAGLGARELVSDPETLRDRTLGGLEPWGWSPEAASTLASLGAPAWDAGRSRTYDKTALPDLRAAIADALGAPDWLSTLSGRVARTVAEVEGAGAAVVKAPYSTSGRNRRRVTAPPSAADRAWLARALATGPVLVEPWLDRALDLSLHADLGADGTMRIRGWTTFETTSGGRWTATQLSAGGPRLPSPVARALAGPPHRLSLAAAALARVVGPWLAGRGHQGPVGIDAMVVRDGDRLLLAPLVEINPRWTMGRVGLALSRSLGGGASGRFFVLRDADLPGAGALRDRAEAWERAAPLQTDAGRRWTAGRLLLTDPATATGAIAAVELGSPQSP